MTFVFDHFTFHLIVSFSRAPLSCSPCRQALFARYGHGAYCRQSLIGGNYGLLDKDTFQPNPDYYTLLLWSRLMGPRVLDMQSDPTNPQLRAYAHCTALEYPYVAPGSGSVTLLLINLSNSTSAAVQPHFLSSAFQSTSSSTSSSSSRTSTSPAQHRFLLTSGGGPSIQEQLASHQIQLNGRLLQASSSAGIPDLPPVIVEGDALQSVLMPPLSYAFVVLANVLANLCL
jgi:heparanase 1